MWDLLKSKVSSFISRIKGEIQNGVKLTYYELSGKVVDLNEKYDAVFSSDLEEDFSLIKTVNTLIKDSRLREADYEIAEENVVSFLNYLKNDYWGKSVAVVARPSVGKVFDSLIKEKKSHSKEKSEYFFDKEFAIEKKSEVQPQKEKEDIKAQSISESRELKNVQSQNVQTQKEKENIRAQHNLELRELKSAQTQNVLPQKVLPQKEKEDIKDQGISELRELKNVQSQKEEGIKVRVGITDHIKKAIFRKIRLSPEKVDEIVQELEFSLIQADVHPDISREICDRIKEKLLSKEYGSDEDLENEIRKVLIEVFLEEAFGGNKPFDIIEKVKNCKKPCKILFVGPNGAGKTTTIAKVARMLINNGFRVVISASDTFRAAAIEQTEEHGKRLGVKVIKHDYGGDAAAVAFDAIKHAEANGIDVVLIDSAGRQDTNFNLLRELEKINRVTKPDIKIFVGESLAGNALYQQVKRFNEVIPLDGVILTKADCDAKGGAVISILRETNVPVIYLGTGQSYEDLIKFEPKYVIDKIM